MPPSQLHTCSAAALRVLVAHEQHLQRVGSDRRLLALLRSMRSLGVEVSLLVRTAKCSSCTRSPPTATLARLLGARSTVAHRLQPNATTLEAPPAIYEYAGTQSVIALLHRSRFDLFLVGLWFWYDPQPSFAELLLPVLHAHAGWSEGHLAATRPLIALLSDDAHAERARRLGDEERDADHARAYRTQARNLALRQRAMYAAADGVFYISKADRAAESRLRAQAGHLHAELLRMALSASNAAAAPPTPSPLSFLPSQPTTITAAATAVAATAVAATAVVSAAATTVAAAAEEDERTSPVWIGFVGDGHTATNALGIQRFLREGWPQLRRAWPQARLRLVGRMPSGHSAGQRERHGGKSAPCAPSERRCGWAWGSECANREAACGIDSLGYLSDGELVAELSRWRVMLVPIFATTGVNTKLLLGLEYGVPIVATSAAAAPLAIHGPLGQLPSTDGAQLEPTDGWVAALGNTSMELATLTGALLDDHAVAGRLAAAGRAHFKRLAQSPHPRQDVQAMLAWVCNAQREVASHARELPSGAADTVWPSVRRSRLRLSSSLQHPAASSACAPSSPTSKERVGAGVVVVSSCGLSEAWPGAWRVRAVWEALCTECALKCAHAPRTHRWAIASRGGVHLWIDESCRLQPDDIDGPQRFLAFAWDPAMARELYHRRGGLLSAMVASEALAASVMAPCSTPAARQSQALAAGERCDAQANRTGLVVRSDRLRSRAAWLVAWRDAFMMALGVRNATVVDMLVERVAEPHRAAFINDLQAHVKHPSWSPPMPGRHL